MDGICLSIDVGCLNHQDLARDVRYGGPYIDENILALALLADLLQRAIRELTISIVLVFDEELEVEVLSLMPLRRPRFPLLGCCR